MKCLEVRVPPPAVAVLVGILMWLSPRLFPALDFDVPARGMVAATLAIVGLVMGAAAFLQFRRAGTTPNPMRPHESTTLVAAGLYRYSRNPMYLGDVLILAGWAVWLANAAAFLGLPVFVAYINRFQIAPEERALEARYGAAYAHYRRAVRRWI